MVVGGGATASLSEVASAWSMTAVGVIRSVEGRVEDAVEAVFEEVAARFLRCLTRLCSMRIRAAEGMAGYLYTCAAYIAVIAT